MNGISLLHWLILILILAAWIVPLWRILGRLGLSQGWALLALIPPLAPIALWVIPFSDWPSSSKVSQA